MSATYDNMIDNSEAVLDFLYHDSRRIGSFLSQFDSRGLLTGLKRAEGEIKGTKRGKKVGVGANTPLGGGNFQFELGAGDSGSQNIERDYDPFWTNARQFIDLLESKGLIRPDISQADMGDFVLATGWLSVLDLVMFKEAWKLPAIQRTIFGGVGSNNPTGNLTAAQRTAAKEQKANTELVLELIQLMPHSAHASMITSHDNPRMIWSPLREEYMVIPASELILMHGVTIPGEWSILGVMNAQPDYVVSGLNPTPDDTEPGFMHSAVGKMSNLIAPLVRVALGRPAAASAVTPLLIYREIAKTAQPS